MDYKSNSSISPYLLFICIFKKHPWLIQTNKQWWYDVCSKLCLSFFFLSLSSWTRIRATVSTMPMTTTTRRMMVTMMTLIVFLMCVWETTIWPLHRTQKRQNDDVWQIDSKQERKEIQLTSATRSLTDGIDLLFSIDFIIHSIVRCPYSNSCSINNRSKTKG
jgi:hypothetical protein